MATIVEYLLQRREDGVGFRLLFDDHTWKDTEYVIPDMKAAYDCDGFCDDEANISYVLSDIKDNDLTEDVFIEALNKAYGLSGKAHTYVANYVEFDKNNNKVLREEHIVVSGPKGFVDYSEDKIDSLNDHSIVQWNMIGFNPFGEFRFVDEDTNILYYTYLEVY